MAALRRNDALSGADKQGAACQPERPLRVLACPKHNAYNPYTKLLYDNLCRANGRLRVDGFRWWRPLFTRYDIIHLHWPEFHFSFWPGKILPVLASLVFITGLSWIRFLGAKVVWTAHNLNSHERADCPVAIRFRDIFLRFLDGVIFLSRASRREFLEQRPEAERLPYQIIPHGHYREVVSQPPPLAQAAGTRTLLYFGQIRPYKNVEPLIDCFRRARVPGWRLVIAGKPSTPEMDEAVRQAAQGTSSVELRLGFIPQEQLDEMVARADLVVLPYKRILNSGAVLYALSLGRPVLGPALGSLPEVQDHVGSNWLRLFNAEDAGLTPQLLRSELLLYQDPGLGGAKPWLGWADWRSIADQTHAFFQRVTAT